MRITLIRTTPCWEADWESFQLILGDEKDGFLHLTFSDEILKEITTTLIPTAKSIAKNRFADMRVAVKENEVECKFEGSVYGSNLYMDVVDDYFNTELLNERGWGRRLHFTENDIYFELYDYKLNNKGILWNITDLMLENEEIKKVLKPCLDHPTKTR